MYTTKTPAARLSNLHKNCLGTLSFDGKFAGMRKAQEFDVYPLHAGDDATRVKVQSETRIGYIFLADGRIVMSKPIASGAYNAHLAQATHIDTLSGEELLLLKAQVMATASGRAGSTGIVHTDNSAALNVFSGT